MIDIERRIAMSEVTFIKPNGAYACLTQALPEVVIGLGKDRAEKYVTKMAKDPDFSDGIIRPTQKTTIVIIERFIGFMRKMEDERL